MATNGETDPNARIPTERVETAPIVAEPGTIRLRWKTLLGTLALLGVAGTGLTFAWAASTSFNEKAPKSAVRALQQRHVEDVHRLEMGVYRVRLEQRTIMRAVAPKEAEKLAPVPVPPPPKPFPEME